MKQVSDFIDKVIAIHRKKKAGVALAYGWIWNVDFSVDKFTWSEIKIAG